MTMHRSIGLLILTRSNAVQLALEAPDLDAKPLLEVTRSLLLAAGETAEDIDHRDAQTARYHVEWDALTPAQRAARLRATTAKQFAEDQAVLARESKPVDAMVSEAVGRECALTEDDEPKQVTA